MRLGKRGASVLFEWLELLMRGAARHASGLLVTCLSYALIRARLYIPRSPQPLTVLQLPDSD